MLKAKNELVVVFVQTLGKCFGSWVQKGIGTLTRDSVFQWDTILVVPSHVFLLHSKLYLYEREHWQLVHRKNCARLHICLAFWMFTFSCKKWHGDTAQFAADCCEDPVCRDKQGVVIWSQHDSSLVDVLWSKAHWSPCCGCSASRDVLSTTLNRAT